LAVTIAEAKEILDAGVAGERRLIQFLEKIL